MSSFVPPTFLVTQNNKHHVKKAYLSTQYIVYCGREVKVLEWKMDANIASSVRSLERDDSGIKFDFSPFYFNHSGSLFHWMVQSTARVGFSSFWKPLIEMPGSISLRGF